jgi:hypothetical protein
MKAESIKKNFNAFRSKYNNIDGTFSGFWSYPIFTRSPNNITLWFYIILGVIRKPEDKRTYLFRPKASLLTSPNSFKLLKFDNFIDGHDPFPKMNNNTSIGVFPHDSIENLTYSEFNQKEKDLIESCFSESQFFTEKKNLSDSFKKTYTMMSNPALTQFIKNLAPEFHSLIWQ